MNIKQASIFFLFLFLLVTSQSFFLFSGEIIIDSFTYDTVQEARAVWQAGYGFPPVEIGMDGDDSYIEAPINFEAGQTRHYWDGLLSLDLSRQDRIVLELDLPHPGIISTFTLYFHCSTTNTWAFSTRETLQTGRQVWVYQKSDFSYHSEDFNWSTIDRIRLSPWMNQEGTSFLRFYNFYAYPPDIYVVKQFESSSPGTAADTANRVKSLLSGLDLYSKIITSTDVEDGLLNEAKVAFYPYNDNISTLEMQKITDFVQSGGKLVVFYLLGNDMADLLGINNLGWQGKQTQGYVFDAEDIAGLPARVTQNSWNFYHAVPNRDDTRILAFWEDSDSELTQYPAWLLSDTGAYMSHIVLNDDPANTAQAFLAITGALYPPIWFDKVEAALENIGRIAYYEDYSQAVSAIEGLAGNSPRKKEVLDFLEVAETLRISAQSLFQDEDYSEAINTAQLAREALLEAYYRVHQGKPGEFRAIWESAGTGIKPGDWEHSINHLHELGFNAIIPIMAWGATAHYESDYLLPSQVYTEHGDQLAQLVEAARESGFAVHPRKINWWDSSAPADWLNNMRQQGRLQKSVYGEENNWLCPSHPENRQLELNSFLEMVQNYDIDGIHMDYIRYESRNYCYCDGCRQRFEDHLGESVVNWPQDCYSGHLQEAYADWRVELITSLVRTISEEARAIDPDILVSAAVFSRYDRDWRNVGQDWVGWCKSGYLDFVCPMNYTLNINTFEGLITRQKELLEGSVPMYPGIKGYDISSDKVIPQIISSRDHQFNGFVLFNYAAFSINHILPHLEKGVLKDPHTSVADYPLHQ